MSKRIINISIFLLIAIFCACGFISFNCNNINTAYAAESSVECYTLIERDAINDTKTDYVSTNVAGTMNGLGYYTVGQTANLQVTAGDNYYIAGFKIIYIDQANKIEYAWLDENNEFTHNLTYANGANSTMLITKEQFSPITSSERAAEVRVQISRVGENLQVTPIFDHLYSRIEIDNSSLVLAECESVTINGTTLYYSASEIVDSEITAFDNAYIEDAYIRHYYGRVYLQNGIFYTLHDKLDGTNTQEKIALLEGGFRQYETPSLTLAVDNYYDVWDIELLRDTQFSSEIQDGSVVIHKTENQNTEKISLENFNLEFNTTLHADLQVNIRAHKLHKVEVQFLIDDKTLAENHYGDFFGNVSVDRYGVKANVSSSNYFAAFKNINVDGKNYPTEYFIKSATNNNNKSFNIQGVQKIAKIQDGLTYTYYSFVDMELDGVDQGKNSLSFNDPTNDVIEINVKYSAIKYNINFEYKEKQGDNLVDLIGEDIDPISLSRGESVTLGVGAESIHIAKDISIEGYVYMGLSFDASMASEIEDDLIVSIDEQKPTDIIVYVVFEKNEYSIVLSGFNSINLRGMYAINNLKFNISGEDETFINDGTLTQYTLANKIKITQSISLNAEVNIGLNVLFSLKQDGSMPIETLELTAEILKLIEENVLHIYAIESFKTYTLEYVTQVRYDENLKANVIMADLAAEKVDVLNDDVQISTVQEVLDGNHQVIENKIIISGLYYGDKVKLNSSGKTQTINDESYTYIFTKFYKGQVTNTLTQGVDNYTYTQGDIAEIIYVVYGLPRVALEIEWTTLLQDEFEYTVADSAGELDPIESNPNEFRPSVGETVTVTVSNIKFGYELTKYNFNNVDQNLQAGTYYIRVSIGPNINRLVLYFSLESYRFAFRQWGEGYNGESYEFNGVAYNSMTVDNRTTIISLPEGMYVQKSSVEGRELKDVLQADGFTQNNSTTEITYTFELTLAQFEELVQNYSVTDANGRIVIINLTYKLHEYNLTFKLVINEGLDEYNSTIAAPSLTVVDGDNKPIISNSNNGNSIQDFMGIKYGTSVSLFVGDDLKQGLKFSKWSLAGDITQIMDNGLTINKMTSNVVAEYIVVYVHYSITLYNYAGNGSPVVMVNGVNSSTIKMFDSLSISPSPDPGIRIKNIRNIQLYTYNSATWLTDYTLLFYREKDEVLPATEIYDAKKLYFYEEKILQTNALSGNLMYGDDQFDAEDYYISTITKGQQTLRCVCIDLEYEYIPYTITHNVTGLEEDWLAMFGDINIYSFIVNGGELDLTQTYSKNESLNYIFKISDQAHIGDLAYNLTSNVTLKSLKINDNAITLPSNKNGNYPIVFNVENHLPNNGETICVEYELQITQKVVIVKTQIEDDKTGTFKDGLEFQIGQENSAPQPTYGELYVRESFDYLSNITTIKAQFNNKELKSAFEFGEVQIYIGDNKKALNTSECEALGITIVRNGSAVTNVMYRLDHDITCVFIVRPIIKGFQSGAKFSKEFKCDSSGTGIMQPLTVGDGKEINISDAFQVAVEYYNSRGNKVDNPTDVGIYQVIISFNGEGWMAQIGEIGTATLEITPKIIEATYDSSAIKKTKVYNGSSDYYMSTEEINNIVFDFKSFTDGKAVKLKYEIVKNWANNTISLNTSKISAFSTTGGETGKVENANENMYYNLYVQGLVINSGNFSLYSTTFEIPNYLQIQRKQISLINVNVQNKVFDNTTTAKVQQQSGKAIDVIGEIEGEQIIINSSLLIVNFEDKEVGLNKKVSVKNIRNALTEINCNANNYTIENEMEVETKAGIYPDRITKKIEGLGEVSIINLRGLNSDDNNLITLIPINARLEVNIIYQDSQEYRNVYRVFGKNVRGNNEFAIGYTFKLVSNETVKDVSKDLYVQVPNIKRITGAYYLTGQSSGKIDYAETGEGIIIDLQGLSVDLDKLMFTQQRILLKVWQIVLIVILFILLIVIIVLIIIIIRRKKKKDYSVHEKI